MGTVRQSAASSGSVAKAAPRFSGRVTDPSAIAVLCGNCPSPQPIDRLTISVSDGICPACGDVSVLLLKLT